MNKYATIKKDMRIYTVTNLALNKAVYTGNDKRKAEAVATSCMRHGHTAKIVGRDVLEQAIAMTNEKTIADTRKGLTL